MAHNANGYKIHRSFHCQSILCTLLNEHLTQYTVLVHSGGILINLLTLGTTLHLVWSHCSQWELLKE